MGFYSEYISGKDRRPQKRACHWFIIFIAVLFLFLLALESVAYIILGAWHLSIPRLHNLQNFSGPIYRRELAFGILLVILGSFGLFICVIGLIAIILLRSILLRIVSEMNAWKTFEMILFCWFLVCTVSMVDDDLGYYYWNHWNNIFM